MVLDAISACTCSESLCSSSVLGSPALHSLQKLDKDAISQGFCRVSRVHRDMDFPLHQRTRRVRPFFFSTEHSNTANVCLFAYHIHQAALRADFTAKQSQSCKAHQRQQYGNENPRVAASSTPATECRWAYGSGSKGQCRVPHNGGRCMCAPAVQGGKQILQYDSRAQCNFVRSLFQAS